MIFQGFDTLPFFYNGHRVLPSMGLRGERGLHVDGGPIFDTTLLGPYLGNDLLEVTQEFLSFSGDDLDGGQHVNHSGSSQG